MKDASEKSVRIVVDAAESASGIPGLLMKMPGAVVELAKLECGDYLIGPGNRVAVERKSNQDFAASILDNRLFQQLSLLEQQYEMVVLLIEGSIKNTRSEIKVESLMGAMSYLAVLAKVRLVWTDTAQDTATLIHTMGRHLEHGLGYEIALRTDKPKDPKRMKEFIVEGLPGVGPGRARALVDHFGSVRAVVNASAQELSKVKGIGGKTAEGIEAAVR